MSVQITSTTDSDEQVAQATAGITAKPESESKTKSASDADKASDETTDESETSEKDSDDSDNTEKLEAKEGDENDVEEKPQKKTAVQKRFDKLTKRAADKEREADYWKAEALKGKTQTSDSKSETTQTKSESTGKPLADDYDSHAEYVEAVSDWKVEQKLKERDAQQKELSAKSNYEQQLSDHRDKAKAFAKQHPDFDELIEEISEVVLSPAVHQSLLDIGPALIYELAKNPKELERINGLSANQALREIG